jgi:hypothetical protein
MVYYRKREERKNRRQERGKVRGKRQTLYFGE